MMSRLGFTSAGTSCFPFPEPRYGALQTYCVDITCSCSGEEDARPGEGICGESSAGASASLPLQSDSSESDRCVSIGILHQPVEYPVVAVATRRFVVPDDGRVCAIIIGSYSIDGSSRWCTESPSQVISLKGLLPGSWTVRVETVDWCE
jgi:hypothetical protein